MHSLKRNQPLILICLYASLWLLLFRDSLKTISMNLLKESNHIHLFLFLSVSGLILFQGFKKRALLKQTDNRISPRLLTLYLFLIASHLICLHFQFSLLSFMLCIIGLYILPLTQYKPPKKWPLLPLFVLLSTLPFVSHINGLIGFPIRLIMAKVIQGIFSLFNIASLGYDTIIQIENRITNIEVACSGIKGLWGANLAFFSLSWIEHKKLSFTWFLSYPLFTGLIIIGNLLRVTLLVSLYTLWNKPTIADAIHVPLGILMFCIPVGVLFFLFRKSPLLSSVTEEIHLKDNSQYISAYFIPALLVIILPFTRITPEELPSPKRITIETMPTCIAQELPLTNGEKELYSTYGISSYNKMRFYNHILSGSVLIVESSQWKSHHNPHKCFQAQGLSIQKTTLIPLDTNNAICESHLVGQKQNRTAYSWFQSPKEITDDYSKRIWKHLFHKEKRWVMVTILFDRITSLEDQESREVVLWLQKEVKTILQRGSHNE